MQQVENELDQVQEQLTSANNKLDEKEKALQTVSGASSPADAGDHAQRFAHSAFSFFLLRIT